MAAVKRIFQASISPIGILGWIMEIIRGALWVIDKLAEADFVRTYLGEFGTFLQSGWGTLVCVLGGAAIIGYSIIQGLRKSGAQPTSLVAPVRLAYLNNRDSELGSAIQGMVRRSAWGKWFAAAQLVSTGQPITEIMQLQIASHLVLENLIDGKLEARGRPPTSSSYEIIREQTGGSPHCFSFQIR